MNLATLSRAQGSSIPFFRITLLNMFWCLYSFTAVHVTDASGIVWEFAVEFGLRKSPSRLLVSSTSRHSFSSTRGDGCDPFPSCSVCANRGMACVSLRVLPFLLQSVCFFGLFALSSLMFRLLLLLQLLLLLRLSSHPHLLPNRSTLALHNFLHFHCCTSSLILQVCL